MVFVKICKPAAVFGLCLAMAGCYGCSTKQDPDKLREKTAETTANLKQDTKAIAAGIKEGLSRDERLDLNTASAKELETLPGITPQLAQKIIANRPYRVTRDLVVKRVLTPVEFNRIGTKVKVEKTATTNK